MGRDDNMDQLKIELYLHVYSEFISKFIELIELYLHAYSELTGSFIVELTGTLSLLLHGIIVIYCIYHM